MANPIAFEPKKIDPRKELERRLEAAPREHAEALLVAFDVLEEAHSQGLLDMLHGALGSRDAIFGKLAEYAKQPLSTNAIRNLLIFATLLGSLDPEVLSSALKPLTRIATREEDPPSLWALFKRVRSKDGRRGLGVLTALVAGIGRASAS